MLLLLTEQNPKGWPQPGPGHIQAQGPPSHRAVLGVGTLWRFTPVCRLGTALLGLSGIQAAQNPVITSTEIPFCPSQVLGAGQGCL